MDRIFISKIYFFEGIVFKVLVCLCGWYSVDIFVRSVVVLWIFGGFNV